MTRKTRRRFSAIIALFFIIFMQIGPFALSAFAWSPPSWNAPDAKVPSGKTPNWETPEWEAPETESPDWEVKEWDRPEWEAPDWNGNGGNTPDSNAPGANTPGSNVPGANVPGGNGPGGNLPGGDVPDGTSPDGTGIGGGGGSGAHPDNGNGSTPEYVQDKPHPFQDDMDYQRNKFLMDDVFFPAIEALDQAPGQNTWDTFGENYNKNLMTNVLKAGLNHTFDNDETALGAAGRLGMDVWSGVENAQHLSKFFKSGSDIRNAFNTVSSAGSFSAATTEAGSLLSKVAKPFDMGTGIAGKAAPWLAAVSTAYSGAETYMNFANGDVNDGIASLGETLMSGAVVLSATGAGAPVAAGVAVVGGVLWAGAKIYKHKDTIVAGAKKVGEWAKKGWNKVKGWFGG